MSELTANQVDALLEALQTARGEIENPEHAKTANELAGEMRCDIKEARRRIGILLRERRAECVRVKRPRIDGRDQYVPAYRLIA